MHSQVFGAGPGYAGPKRLGQALFLVEQQIVPFGQDTRPVGGSPGVVILDDLDLVQRRQGALGHDVAAYRTAPDGIQDLLRFLG